MKAEPRRHRSALDAAALRRAVHHALHDGSPAVVLHRLHALLLLAQIGSVSGAAALGGDSLRSLQRWRQRWLDGGVAGLRAASPHGRPAHFCAEQWARLADTVCEADRLARASGRKPMSAAALQALLERTDARVLSRRQCQRLLAQLRLRGPSKDPETDWADTPAPVDVSEPARRGAHRSLSVLGV